MGYPTNFATETYNSTFAPSKMVVNALKTMYNDYGTIISFWAYFRFLLLDDIMARTSGIEIEDSLSLVLKEY